MKPHKILSLLFLATAASVPAPASPCRAQTTDKTALPQECLLSSEDYAVYSAIFLDRGKPEDLEERWDDKPELIISEVTYSGEDGKSNMWGFRSASNQKPSDDTVAHFNLRQKSSCHLKAQLNPAISYRFLPKEEEEGFFKKGVGHGWKAFYKKFPKSSGIWSVSPVGYDAQGTEALVYVAHSCGGLCGTGHLVLLEKENGHWVVKNRLMLWIS